MPGFVRIAIVALLLAGCTATETTSIDSRVDSGAAVAKGLSNQFTALPDGWNTIRPGGDTRCSDDSDYVFYVRAGDPDKLLVYLQGGGACWNMQTCDPLHEPTYSIKAAPTFPARYDGIFNYQRSNNPFKDYTVVFAPYCSADVHIGNAEHSYTRTPEQKSKIRAKGQFEGTIPDTFQIAHRGFANAGAALDWTQANVSAPGHIFVTGSSAGSIPSPYYAMRMARLYPGAQVMQLGDGAGGYRRINQLSNPNLAWNTVAELRAEPAFADLTNATFNYEQLYIRAAQATPRVQFNAYDAAEDDVQKRFLKLADVPVPSLLAAITANQDDIRTRVPGFRSYVAGGDSHTILARPEFYTFTVGKRSVRDWVASLASGKPVSNVVCQRCDSAETQMGQ